MDKPLTEHWVEDGPGFQTYSSSPIPIQVALGTARDGTSCTLVDAYSFGTGITASSLLLGHHFQCKADARFASAELNLTHLEERTEHFPLPFPLFPFASPPELPGGTGVDPEKPWRVDVAYRRKKLLEVEIPSRRCRVEIHSGVAPAWYVYKSLTLRHATLFFVEPTSPQDLPWYRQFFLDCSRLFSFLVGSRVCRTSTLLSPELTGDQTEPARDVELYDQNLSAATTEETDPEKMPLPFHFLEPVARDVFDKWFSTASELGPVHQLLLETLPPNDLGLETVLLRLAQALEVFHRRSLKETYVDKVDYRRYYRAIRKAFPEEMPLPLRERLRNHLAYGNEYSLKSVIERLIEGLTEPARSALQRRRSELFR